VTTGSGALAGIADGLDARGIASFRSLRLPAGFTPTRFLDAPREHDVVASYERPDRGVALVGLGEAGRATSGIGAGPAGARDGARALFEAPWEADDAALRPRVLGGFAFRSDHEPGGPWAGFGVGSLVLPRLLFVQEGDVRGVVVAPGVRAAEVEARLAPLSRGAAPPDATASPLRAARGIDRDGWRASVQAVATEVRAGVYEKVVLATTQEFERDTDIDVGRTLARLRTNYPECHVFSIVRGDATFLGASPELLVAVRDGRVEALGLAGSARRGATPEEDDEIGRALLASAKDRMEHETVVRAIREALADVTERLVAPNQPRLRRLRNIQHLATEIGGRVRRGVDVLELAERLHPTPAVCGWPRLAAQHVISVLESFDRGWYAGPIGWMDAHGEGEFAVGLRVALVRHARAWLFAGNGIMGDSDPDAELAEVQLKFRPLAEALSGVPS